MQAFYCDDGTVIRYSRGLAFVSIQDELEVEILSQDFREFLEFLRDAELNYSVPIEGTFYGLYNTVFRFTQDLSQVTIEDNEGRRIVTTCIQEFAQMIRETSLKRTLEESGLGGVL